MIGEILLLALGALLLLAAVLLRKRLPKTWLASLTAAGLLIVLAGGWFTWGQISQRRSEREAVYLGLRYLESRETDSAAFYLRKSGAAGDFVPASARCLMERMRENQLTARLNLDIAASYARSEEEKELLSALERVDVFDGEQVSVLTEQLRRRLRLSEKRQEALDLYVRMENGYGWDPEAAAGVGLDETGAARLTVGAMLDSGSYEAAVTAAARLVEDHPSAGNRLLLAEAVAESAYRGVPLSAGDFTPEEGEPDSSAEKERTGLETRRAKAEGDLLTVELSLETASDEAEIQRLNQRRLELTELIRELRQRSDKLYVYRAFSALADLHSLEADLVRARLYFALQNYEQAVDTLRDAARSVQAKLTPDKSLANSLRVLEQTYAGGGAFYDSQEFRDSMVQLLSAPFPDLMHVSRGTLTRDFMQRIVSDQKSYGRGLAVSGFDLSGYPVIRVTLSGREELLRQVVEKSGATARDTRQTVDYTARLETGAVSDICVVVDRSGSMSGGPMEDLKAALTEFIGGAQEEMSLSLVAFDSTAELLTERTQDRARLLSAVESLGGNGGTEITAGIRGGVEALEQAAGGRIMLLMTDGQSSVDLTAADEAAAQGITIHTIGFGDVNDQVLSEIAERTGGQYVKADDSSELGNVYASLQQIIGTLVTLEYTAPEAEETESRYFFLSLDFYSVRREYLLPLAEEAGGRLYACSPGAVSPDTLRRQAEQGNPLNLTLYGEDLLGVETISVGGRPAQILEKQDTYMRVAADPSLGSGWQTVSITGADGESAEFDRLLIVGETASYRDIRLGSILIPYAQGVLPGDGTLVLTGNFGVREYTGDGSYGSLDLSVNGALILPWREQPEDGSAGGTDLGDQGTAEGWGLVTVGSGDGAYARGGPAVVAKGGLELSCEREQSRLTQAGEAVE